MISKAGSVAQAYLATQKLQTAADGEGGSFASLLADTLGTAANAGKTADALKAKAASGARPELIDVVTATAESELALETLVAVRDKVVQAYDDIMRMPI